MMKASKELLGLLNDAIAREIQVSIQYMWQHVQWGGVKGFAVKDELASIAKVEMKHAEKIAERLYYLGGTPTTKPTPIKVGGTLEEMVKDDVQAEDEAIEMYTKIIELAAREGDSTTRLMFEEILTAE